MDAKSWRPWMARWFIRGHRYGTEPKEDYCSDPLYTEEDAKSTFGQIVEAYTRELPAKLVTLADGKVLFRDERDGVFLEVWIDREDPTDRDDAPDALLLGDY